MPITPSNTCRGLSRQAKTHSKTRKTEGRAQVSWESPAWIGGEKKVAGNGSRWTWPSRQVCESGHWDTGTLGLEVPMLVPVTRWNTDLVPLTSNLQRWAKAKERHSHTGTQKKHVTETLPLRHHRKRNTPPHSGLWGTRLLTPITTPSSTSFPRFASLPDWRRTTSVHDSGDFFFPEVSSSHGNQNTFPKKKHTSILYICLHLNGRLPLFYLFIHLFLVLWYSFFTLKT